MYIIIGGGGIAGGALARDLIDHKHSVVVVEPDREACETLYAQTGAVTVTGSALDINVLDEAGIGRADVAIAAMYRDVDNLTFSLLARSRRVPRIIAKMRDPSYRDAFEAAGVTTICDVVGMLRRKVSDTLAAEELAQEVVGNTMLV